MFDTREEAAQKLANTIVLYDNEPAMITGIGGGNNSPVPIFFFLADKARNQYEKPINDKKFEFRNLGGRLGYINVDWRDYHQSIWSRRIPIRKAHSTQGLSQYNIKIDPLAPDPVLGLRRTDLGWMHIRDLEGFCNTLKQTYPSLKVVADKLSVDKTRHSMAFGRMLALRRSELGLFYLLYKGQEIGYTDDFEHFKVPKQFRHLDELLVEEHNLKVV